MNEYLLLFSIGPVQSFITQARKTQDLWGGSRLLSFLCKSTAEEANKRFGAEIILPAVEDKALSTPNRFLAKVRTDAAKQMGADLETFVRELLLKRALEEVETARKQSVRDGLDSQVKMLPDEWNTPEAFTQQIRQFLQVNWVVIPCGEGEYPAKYSEIERWHASVKNVHNFEQRTECSGRKDSLSGEHNVLFYKPTASGNLPQYTIGEAVACYANSLSEGEGLDAPGILKRFWQEGRRVSFPSVAEIALADALDKFKDKALMSEFESKFLDYDPQVLYEENLQDSHLDRYRLLKEDAPDKRAEARELLKQIYKKGFHPLSYYAVVLLDGDDMGAWLSGKKLDAQSQFNLSGLENFHKNVTAAMCSYAASVAQIFSEKKVGRLIYCGGDDVLAFVNLTHLFPLLKSLRREYPDIDGSGRLTASAGVCIAHYKTPLSLVLQYASEAEKTAKKTESKNRLAFTVYKRAGGMQTCGFRWFADDSGSILDALGNIVDACREQILTNSNLKNLVMTVAPLLNEDGNIDNEGMLQSLIRTAVEHGETRNREKRESVIKELCKLSLQLDNTSNFLVCIDMCIFLGRIIES